MYTRNLVPVGQDSKTPPTPSLVSYRLIKLMWIIRSVNNQPPPFPASLPASVRLFACQVSIYRFPSPQSHWSYRSEDSLCLVLISYNFFLSFFLSFLRIFLRNFLIINIPRISKISIFVWK